MSETTEVIEKNCPNCNTIIVDNFCTNCGQKKYKRIDRKYVIDELQYTLLHTNKGLFYSIKKILQNPGKTAREFIEGNRVNHYKPVLLVFLLSGISAFISYKVLGFAEVMKTYYRQQNLNEQVSNEILAFLSSYNAILMLLMVPLFAITTYISFRKWGQNYYEHIVMNCYIVSFYTLVTMLVTYPFYYFVKDNPDSFYLISQISVLFFPLILFWFFKGFYSNYPNKSIILRTLSVIGLTILGYFVLMIVVGIGFAVYAIVQGPEALKQFVPQK